MSLDLTGQVAVITGASRGIGRSVAESLAAAGSHVVLAARSKDALATVARSIRDAGGSASWCVTDVTREEEVDTLFNAVDSDAGPLTILVNNAGVGEFGQLHELSADQFDRVVDTNLKGTFLCCRAAMCRMIPRRRGTIINIASVVGFKGYPNQSAYAASKHGVMGITKSLAVEAQEHAIRVSAVLPGGVDTDMVRESRPDLNADELLAPEDVVQAVSYLLSLSPRAAVDQIFIRRRNSAPFP